MITEAIILAGGKGTRLSGVVNDRPKPMALVQGRPFLEFVLDELVQNGISTVILSVGYQAAFIQKHFNDQYKTIQIRYAVEVEPLGTGGGILQALSHIDSDYCLVMNGDTLFKIDVKGMEQLALEKKADLVLGLKPLQEFERYGTVTTNNEGRVLDFHEKKYQKQGLINGGAYLLRASYLRNLKLDKRFSFEKEILESRYPNDLFFGFTNDDYFIDIGIPEDYERAQREL